MSCVDDAVQVWFIDGCCPRFSPSLHRWVSWFLTPCSRRPHKVGVCAGCLLKGFLILILPANLRGKEVPHIYTVIKEWVLDQRVRVCVCTPSFFIFSVQKREKPRPYFNWDSFVEAFPGYDPYLLERGTVFAKICFLLFFNVLQPASSCTTWECCFWPNAQLATSKVRVFMIDA